jgi:hypothetical protein
MNAETRLAQLRQLLAEAREREDLDKVTELESNLLLEFPGQTSSQGEVEV